MSRLFLFLILISALGAQEKRGLSSLEKDIRFLGSDSLRGRATGSPGLKKAAAYIAARFREAGLLKMGNNNSYLQSVPLHGQTILPSTMLTLSSPGNGMHLKYGRDFLLIRTGELSLLTRPTPMVFAGYGINAPEYEYNDYRNINAAGKVVVVLEGEPFSPADSSYFAGTLPSVYSSPESKLRLALANGAFGMIIIPGSAWNWTRLKREYSFEDVSLPGAVSSTTGLFVTDSVSRLLFSGEKEAYAELLAKAGNNLLSAFDLKKTISLHSTVQRREFISQNVAGLLPGGDEELKDSYVLVSAHYDHLGIGPAVEGDSIYNGVSDNAVGSAVVLELARRFSRLDYRPRRSILFLLLTGEEKGLLGSRYYTKHPLVPLYKTVAAFNVDGLAAMGEFQDIYAIGAGQSQLKTLIRDVAAENGFRLAPLRYRRQLWELFARSDQISFARGGIPSTIIIEALTYKDIPLDQVLQRLDHWYQKRYHTPFDDLEQPLDPGSLERYVSLLFHIVNRVANMSAAPQWNAGAPYLNRRLQTRAEKR